MREMRIVLFLSLLLLPLQGIAQVQIKIKNIEESTPLINASIYDDSNQLLGNTNELGEIILQKNIDRIFILADGFKKKTENIGNLDKSIYLFKSHKKTKSDPKALYILKKLWEEGRKNSPNYLENYKFDSYTKFTLDMSADSVIYIQNPETKLDSLNNNFKKLLEKSMIFIGERTMSYEYDKKYGRKAIVTAYKAGGFDKPELYNAAISQSMVNNYPEILKPREVQNNISRLVDSIYINGRKTYEIYTYSKGRSDTHFYRSLSVFVDANSFALVKLIGNTSQVSDVYYEILYTPYNNIWYTELEYTKKRVLSNNFINKINKILPKALHSITHLSTTVTTESHFSNFKSPVVYDPKKFNGYEYELSEDVSTDVDAKISAFREDNLTERETSTYFELDRLFKKYNLESKFRFLRSLSSGKLELGFFSLDVYNLISHNLYESFRYQVGGHTNDKLSSNLRIGGYAAKAILDGKMKGGADITFFINKKQGGELTFKAETDILPAGRTKTKYLTPKDMLSAKSNNVYNSTYFSYKTMELSYQQDFFKNIDITFSLDYQRQRANFDYTFKDYTKNTWFNYVNTAIRLRYAPKVKYIKTPLGKSTLQDKPPYYYFTYSKSWNLFKDSNPTHSLYLSTIYSFMSKYGTTEIIGNIGATFGDTPIMNAYEGMGVAKHGNSLWGRFSVNSFQSFETMEPSTFFSNKFASIQFTHHLRPIRVNEFKSLHFALIYKGLIGTMEKKYNHNLFEFEVPKDYYQEIGIEANKLLLGFVGVGIYSKLGAYRAASFDKNLYIKLTLDL